MRRTAFLLAALGMACALPLAAQTPVAPTPTVGDEEAGRAAFNTECRTCHAGAIAPVLRGVVGRKIASDPDFGGYSPGLKGHGEETWTEQSLDAFLKAPAEFAPGALMTKAMTADQTRADIIAYLKAISQSAE